MKCSDDEFDEKNNRNLAIFLGIICGIFAAYATVTSMDAAYIFIGILVGNLLAMKVDGVHHIATLLTFLIIVLLENVIVMLMLEIIRFIKKLFL